MSKTALLAVILCTSYLAHANNLEDFLGWSKDRSLYAVSLLNDGTAVDNVRLCLSDAKVPSASWPKAIAPLGAGEVCASLSMSEDGMATGTKCDEASCEGGAEFMAAARKAVVKAKAVKKGSDGKKATISVEAKGKYTLLVNGQTVPFAIDADLMGDEKPELMALYIRDDKRAVAFTVGVPGGTSTWVRAVKPPLDPKAAKAANVRGLKAIKAKKAPEAIAEFRAAIELDPKLAPAHYNLACMLALDGDKEGAIAELVLLGRAAVDDGDAKATELLVGARKDPDLTSVVDDGRVKVPLCQAECVDAFQICAGECAGLDEPGGCGMGCSSHQDSCLEECGK